MKKGEKVKIKIIKSVRFFFNIRLIVLIKTKTLIIEAIADITLNIPGNTLKVSDSKEDLYISQLMEVLEKKTFRGLNSKEDIVLAFKTYTLAWNPAPEE